MKPDVIKRNDLPDALGFEKDMFCEVARLTEKLFWKRFAAAA